MMSIVKKLSIPFASLAVLFFFIVIFHTDEVGVIIPHHHHFFEWLSLLFSLLFFSTVQLQHIKNKWIYFSFFVAIVTNIFFMWLSGHNHSIKPIATVIEINFFFILHFLFLKYETYSHVKDILLEKE